MILSCNSCEKKFVVPDNAIGESGRLVQCSSCGNKWKQFPIKTKEKKTSTPKATATQSVKKPINSKIQAVKKRPSNRKKKVAKKTREVNLYSPEYLAKKHGIKIKDNEQTAPKKTIAKDKISFGFYNSLLVFLLFVIFFSRTLYFAQSFIVTLFPSMEFYLVCFFENIRNVFEIWKSLVAKY